MAARVYRLAVGLSILMYNWQQRVAVGQECGHFTHGGLSPRHSWLVGEALQGVVPLQSCHSSSYTVFYKLCPSPSPHAPSLPPPRERETLLTRRRAEAEHERIRGEQRRVAEAAVNLQPHPEEQTGFIPFYSK